MLPLLLILLFSSVSATEINAPKEIPSNLNWSFNIELEPTNSFTKTEIYFDELLVVIAYNDKQPIIQEDFVLKAFVFDKKPEDNTGLTVFISYFGIAEGTHKIKTKTFNEGNLTEEKEFELKSINTLSALSELPKTFSEDIELLMKGIIKKINEQKTRLDELQDSNEKNLEEKTKALKEEITALENSLKELNEIKNKTQEEKLLQEKEKTEKSGEPAENPVQKENFVTGFYNFSVDKAWIGVIFLIVLLVMLALFQIYKIKSNQTVFEEELEDKDLDEHLEESSLEKIEESTPEKTEKKRGKLSFRDLLKR